MNSLHCWSLICVALCYIKVFYFGTHSAVVERLDADTDMGPLVSKKQLGTVMGYIEKGKEEGARLVTGGNSPEGKGYFVDRRYSPMSRRI